MQTPGLTRRILVQTAASGLAFAPTAAGAFDGPNPRKHDVVRMSRLMDACLEDAVGVFSTGVGTVYGQVHVGARPLPMFGVAVVSGAWSWEQGAETYRLATKQVAIFTDFEHREPLRAFKNPLNGHLCRVFTACEERHERIAPLLDPDGSRTRWTEADGQTIRTTRAVSSLASPTQAAERPSGSAATVSASTTALRRPGSHVVRVALRSRQITPWYPWMLMGSSPGFIVVEADHVRSSPRETLSPAVWSHLSRDHSSVFTAPDKWTTPL